MFGLGSKKIDIIIGKTNFSSGEKITGTIKLSLDKSVKARALRVSVKAIKTERIKSGGESRTSRHTLCDAKIDIDGEKEYPAGDVEYPFEIAVPVGITGGPAFDGALGNAVKAASFLAGRSMRLEWFLTANLDVPLKLDVSKKIQIFVSDQPAAPAGTIAN